MNDTTPVLLGGQTALFDDSDQLLSLSDVQLRRLAVAVGEDAESGLAQMRRRFGLLAWAGWLRFEGSGYEDFVVALARYVGVNPRTVKSWRDAVVEKDSLAVPPATDQRKREATEREEKSRSTRVRAGKQHGTDPIPATSTEAPAKKSEGGEPRGDRPLMGRAVVGSTPTGEVPADPPSTPPSGGARDTAPPRAPTVGPVDRTTPAGRSTPGHHRRTGHRVYPSCDYAKGASLSEVWPGGGQPARTLK